MKKLLVLACLVVALTPFSARAQNSQGNDNSQGDNGSKPRVRAVEMTEIGLGVAALAGVAGYVVLRKRHSA